KPPCSSVSAGSAGAPCFSGTGRWARVTGTLIVLIAMSVMASGFQEKSAELWLGGDVNLGDGGGAQLQGISGIVQGAAGIVNLEGPAAQRPQLASSKLRLWNTPKALEELLAIHVRVA